MKFLVAFLIFLPLYSQAKVKVVTTLPDIAEVVREIGQDNVEVQSLLQGNEDPHYAEARPDFILKVNRAAVVCSMGLELETGWLPKVLEKSGNSKVQPGSSTYCELGRTVTALDVPSGVINRSLGDVHAHGNPHFNLSPLKLAEGAKEVLRILTEALPEKKSELQKNYDSFAAKLTALQTKLQKQIKPGKVMEYHKQYTYFFAAYGLSSAGSLEEKPGMPPSAARIAQVAKLAKEQKVVVLYASPSAPHKTLERFQELSGVPVVVVPSYVTNNEKTNSIEKLQTLLVNSMP
jgi:zinc/manganese transport system substrate-binding protein